MKCVALTKDPRGSPEASDLARDNPGPGQELSSSHSTYAKGTAAEYLLLVLSLGHAPVEGSSPIVLWLMDKRTKDWSLWPYLGTSLRGQSILGGTNLGFGQECITAKPIELSNQPCFVCQASKLCTPSPLRVLTPGNGPHHN